jgi:hypothetical protein
MYSSQGFSETEIIGALAFGSFNTRQSKDSGALAASAGGTYLLRELNRQIPELTPLLADLELTQQSVGGSSGSNVLVPTVGVKRYLTPELRLGYSQIVGTAPSGATNLQVRDLGAEYRISRIFYLTGEILERRSGGSSSVTTSSSQSSLEYNLDVRARHEY